MTKSLEKNKSVSCQMLSTHEWYGALGELVAKVGSAEFPDFFNKVINSLIAYDYTVTFAYNGPAMPLCLHHSFQPEQFEIHVTEYVVGPYLLDPFYKATVSGLNTGMHRLRDLAPDQFFQSEYYKSYYVQTGPVDEIAFYFPSSQNWTIVTSLMRSPLKPAFTTRELRIFRCIEPLIRNIAQMHWSQDERLKVFRSVQDEKEALRTAIQEAVNHLGMPALTARELQVVGLVLEGHSSESIASLLDIASGTVRIHRKNIYAKMRISSQRELFAIFMKNPIS